MLFLAPRRQNYRLIIRNNTKGFLIIKDLKFPLMDISARGLAFNTPPKVANYFVKNPIVKEVVIILNEESYLINEAKLIRTKPSKDEPVCPRFSPNNNERRRVVNGSYQ